MGGVGRVGDVGCVLPTLNLQLTNEWGGGVFRWTPPGAICWGGGVCKWGGGGLGTFCATWLTHGLVQLLRSGPRGFQTPRPSRH